MFYCKAKNLYRLRARRHCSLQDVDSARLSTESKTNKHLARFLWTPAPIRSRITKPWSLPSKIYRPEIRDRSVDYKLIHICRTCIVPFLLKRAETIVSGVDRGSSV